MASLTGQLVAETYKALLKLIDNDILTASEKQITDGFGGGSNVFIDSQGFLRANKYKVTNGLATQFLKADGSLDSNAYLTSITGSQVIAALGYTPVPTTRTITINGETHNLAADNSWTVGGTAAIWGNITGTLSNQTDLQNALNAKYNNPTGTISQYIRGDGTLATFPTMPGGLPTGGSAGQILAKIDATDYNTHWIDNYATQTKNDVKLGQTLTKGTPVYVSSANGTNIIVSKASNTSEALSSKTFGLLESGGATNDIVKCVTFGLIAGLDTSTAQAGDPVWLGVNGALIFGLANKPYAPAHLVYIGVVTRVQQNNGEIFVNIQNGFELKEIHDVYIADPANNHGLFYDIADGLWKNKSIAGALGYTPQAQLSGTGFVKASGTIITYDNSTYLTTTDAASTYQRLDKMVSNLLPSATEYPNSNAVIASLALKADAANPVFTGNMTISGAEPKLYFTDTDQNPDYFIGVDAGFFRVYDQTAGATRFVINSDGNISTGIGKSITAGSFIKDGGTATQFLKADGSVDSTVYATSASLANYLLIATAASTYQTLANLSTDLTASATKYPSVNAVNAGLATKQPLDADLTAIAGLTGTSGFLKKTAVDTWTLDTSTYLTTGDASTTYLAITTAASTYQRLDKMVSNLLPSSTEYPNSNAVINALALKANAANPVFTGDLSISGATPRLYFVDTDQNPDYTVFIDSGFFYIYDQTAGATRFSINSSGSATFNGRVNFQSGIDLRPQLPGGFLGLDTGDGNFDIWGISRDYYPSNPTAANAWGIRWNGTNNDIEFVGAGVNRAIIDLDNGNITASTFIGNLTGNVTGNVSGSAGSVAWNNVSSKPSLIFYYQGFTLDANTMDGNASGFTYAVNAPFTGPITRFSETGYSLQLNATYGGGGTSIAYRTRNGDAGTWNSWYTFITTANIGSQSVSSANTVTHYSGRTDGTAYNVVWAAGNPSYMYSCDAVQIQSSTGTLSATNLNATNIGTFGNNSSGNTGIGIYYINNMYGRIRFYNDGLNNSTIHAFGTSWVGGVSQGYINIDGQYGVNIGSWNDPDFGVAKGGTTTVYRALNVNGGGTHSGTTYFVGNGNTGSAAGIGLNVYSNNGSGAIMAFHRGGYYAINMGLDSDNVFRIGGWSAPSNRLQLDMSGHLTVAGSMRANVFYDSENLSYYLDPTQSITSLRINGSIYAGGAYGTDGYSSSSPNVTTRIYGPKGGAFSSDGSTGAIRIKLPFRSNDNMWTMKVRIYNYATNQTSEYLLGNYAYNNGGWNSSATFIGGSNSKPQYVRFGNQDGVDCVWIGETNTGWDYPVVTVMDFTSGFRNANVEIQSYNWNIAVVNSFGSIQTTVFPNIKLGDIYTSFVDSQSGFKSTSNPWGTADSAYFPNGITTAGSTNWIYGYTYIGNAPSNGSGHEFFTNGNARSTGSYTASSFFESSDIRLKTLIESNPIIDGIEKLEAKLYKKNGKIELGYFAQDAKLIMPYAVTKNDEGFLNLSYREVHTAKIARLEQRVQELENQLNLN